MTDAKEVGEAEKKDAGATASTSAPKAKKKGIFSRIWNGIFRDHKDDFEKRLQYITKEEATVVARMKRRSQTLRRMIRHFIIFSVVFEIIAVGYAIATTRSADLNWKMRAFRVLPMFLLPAVSSLSYTALTRFTRMCERKDQKTLEKLRAERQAKIDELKEKTNYYITQQLIQRYDSDPAAKAAAASVLASKLGAESGLKVFVGSDELNPYSQSVGKSNDAEVVPSGGLRNRKKQQTGTGNNNNNNNNTQMHRSTEGTPHSEGMDGQQTYEHDQLVVNHHFPQGPAVSDGGWIARIAALLVGEDPTQSYALICGNCHMHNGLVRKEDFPFVTYYCPHCHALNQTKQIEERVSGSPSPDSGSVRSVRSSDVSKNESETIVSSEEPVTTTLAPPEKHEEVSGTIVASELS